MPDQRLVSGNLCSSKDQSVTLKKKEKKGKHEEMCVINDYWAPHRQCFRNKSNTVIGSESETVALGEKGGRP